MDDLKKTLAKTLKQILMENFSVADPVVELLPTKDNKYGDWYSPLAMKYARQIKCSPEELARGVCQNLPEELKSYFLKIEVKPPGFINFFLGEKFYKDFFAPLLDENKPIPGKDLVSPEEKRKILLEFVSANPTGPLSVAHARQAAIGDSLARILRFAGYDVTTEYYLNDVGVQINLLGLSLKERCKEIVGGSCVIPEGGYKGEYLRELANKFLSIWREKIADLEEIPLEEFSKFAVGEILLLIRKELERFGVSFDNWYSQEIMEKQGKVEEAIAILKEKGLIYEKDGALWFAASKFGDDKDRVIIKSDGTKTYFTADIGYHLDKFRRGYQLLIDMWGPDHHGYIPRVKAALEALGYDPDLLRVVIVQLVTLYKNQQPIPMSTREGKYITIDELIDEVGVDAARFFLLMRRTNSHLDFDLDLAKKQAPENPVYYIQYAYARGKRIIDKALDIRERFSIDLFNKYFYLPKEGPERDLIFSFLLFREAIESVIFDLDPYALVDYLRDLAAKFHKFYERCRIIGEIEEKAIVRYALVLVAVRLLKEGLSLLGVSCPDRM